MIRKNSSEGIGYAVADLSSVRHIFATAVPRQGTTFEEQTRDALSTIRGVIDDETVRGAIVQQTVFLHDHTLIEPCRKLMAEFYGPDLPATAYAVQPPCEGKLMAVEAWGVCRENDGTEIERISEHLVIERHSGCSWAHCAGIAPDIDAEEIHPRSIDAFARMRDVLESHGFRYDQVIRTWLYLGDIVGPEGESQRYKELNRARADFYHDVQFLKNHTPPGLNGSVFPASTGIGAGGREIMMSCIALATDRDDVLLAPLENPLQTAAFDYEAFHSPASPKFCRAMAVASADDVAILVSGTASIVQSKTLFVGDAAGQTRQTLDNIEALIAGDNLARQGIPGMDATLDDLALLRVYVKHQDDYEVARAICEERLGELPTIYTVADVCRPELLIEMEGVAIAHPLQPRP
ncbi:hypothetical protein HQ560_12880 [bacterium]|nr:hypothetical protein [bacterium]